MKTLILHHDDCLKHDPGFRHPERADRVRAVLAAVQNMPGTELLPAPLASQEQVCSAHDPDYWQHLIELEPEADPVMLDPDTFLSPGSIKAALRGSGAACFAIDQVFSGKARNAFCVVRPPGHHAENAIAMGFCLFNHAAVAARHALAVHGVERVAILDFDVHHGNGSQAIFQLSQPKCCTFPATRCRYIRGPAIPDEIGCRKYPQPALGATVPAALNSVRPGRRSACPPVHGFQPDLIIISAGFDAHQSDPLGQIGIAG